MLYTGHLDLQRAWERTFRRAGLPLAYSQGFNPRPRINLASALPLGFTSQAEVMDVWFEYDIPIKSAITIVENALPPGLKLEDLEIVDSKAPPLQTQLQAVEYILTFLEPVPELDLRSIALLQAEHLPRERRGKQYDLRPLILELEILIKDGSGNDRLRVVLKALEGATGRPEELVASLEIAPEMARYHRTGLIFEGETSSRSKDQTFLSD